MSAHDVPNDGPNDGPNDPLETPPSDRHDDLTATIARAKAMGRRALALRHRGLQTLPDELGALEALLELDLTDNLLATVPAPVLALHGLEFLTLARNRLAALPDGLWALTALKDLDLGNAVSLGPDQRYADEPGGPGNRIEALPAGLGALVKLRRLAAGFVGLRAVPAALGGLTDLIALELPGNALETLPETINALTALESLDLSANPLAGLPDGLAGLTGLKGLRLGTMPTPPAVAPLATLERLALPDCGLEALPDWVLALDGLTSLYLAGNPMIDLPEGIGALPALAYLDLSGTGITEPPRHLDLPAGLIVRLGPQRLYQDGRLGHAIGPDGTVIVLAGAEEDDDEETETGPIPSARPQPSGGLGGAAGGVIIHRRAGPHPPDGSGVADETPTRIVHKTPPAQPTGGDDGETRRGPPSKGGLAARVQAAVAQRDADESGTARLPTTDDDKAGDDGDEKAVDQPVVGRPEDATGRTHRNAPAGGLAARVQAAVDGRPGPDRDAGRTEGQRDEGDGGPIEDADKTQMGKRAAARAGQTDSAATPDEDEQEETVSQPRDADGRPIRRSRPD